MCLEKHNKNNEIIPFISCHLRRNSRVNEFLNQEMFRKRITVFENSLIEEMSDNSENISDIWNLKKSRCFILGLKKMNIGMQGNLDVIYSTPD